MRAALVACSLVLAACGRAGSGSEDRVSLGRPVPETTTTTAAAVDSTSPAGGAPATTAPPRPGPAGRAPTARPGAPVRAPGAVDAWLRPAAPGTYRYDTTGAVTFGASRMALPPVTTLRVDLATGERQRTVRDLRDATGNGSVTETVLDYRPEGIFLVEINLSTSFAGLADSRRLAPPAPALVVPTGAAPGFHRELDLALSRGGTARVVVDGVGTEVVRVAGRPVDTLVLRTVVTLSAPDLSGRQELTSSLDRGTRLNVRERSVGDVGAGLLVAHSEQESRLQSLSPS